MSNVGGTLVPRLPQPGNAAPEPANEGHHRKMRLTILTPALAALSVGLLPDPPPAAAGVV